MDFIERIFGITPDGGSGLFEWLLLLIPFLCFTAIAVLCRDVKKSSVRRKLRTLC